MMNKDNIPNKLHHLIDLVKEWGIGDDGYRDEKVESSTNEELRLLVNSINDSDADNLDEWFCSPQMLESPSEEYLRYSEFFMAYEYAEAVLKERTSSSI